MPRCTPYQAHAVYPRRYCSFLIILRSVGGRGIWGKSIASQCHVLACWFPQLLGLKVPCSRKAPFFFFYLLPGYPKCCTMYVGRGEIPTLFSLLLLCKASQYINPSEPNETSYLPYSGRWNNLRASPGGPPKMHRCRSTS